MKPLRVVVDEGVGENSALWQLFQKKRLPQIRLPQKSSAPSVLKELKPDYSPKLAEANLKLANGMAERSLQRLRTRRRRIRSYFGSAANLSSAALTIGALRAKAHVICGHVLRLAANRFRRDGAQAQRPHSDSKFRQGFRATAESNVIFTCVERLL
jgi:hypothetical protein